MAKATVEMLVDDLDGSEGAETIRLGWNGDWRELELSKRNLTSLSKALDKFWDAGRPVSSDGQPKRRRPRRQHRHGQQGQARAEGNPCTGARKRARGTSPRTHPAER